MAGSDTLHWLNEILWPGGDAVLVVSDDPTGLKHDSRWFAAPDSSSPRTLIPTEPTSATRRAVRRYHDGQGLGRRLRSFGVENVLRIVAAPNFGGFRAKVGLEGPSDAGVPGAIRRVLDLPELTFAVTLGSPKSNRKPILQLLDGPTCVGFAKVSATAWTDALIRNEAMWLERAESSDPPLLTPELIFAGELASRFVLIQAAVQPPRLPRRRPTAPPPVALFRAVANLARPNSRTAGDSAWWRSVQDVLGRATRQEADAIHKVDPDLDLALECGAFHGDLAPWNMFTTRQGIHVIDWEFAAPDVPFGFDICHFFVQTAVELKALDAPAALHYAQPRSAAVMGRLGLSPATQLAVWRLYLVELTRRHLALRDANVRASVTQGPAAVHELLRTPAAQR